jgi:hypothetical protein
LIYRYDLHAERLPQLESGQAPALRTLLARPSKLVIAFCDGSKGYPEH